MEKNSQVLNSFESETELELPPGFRFHPTDEELITYYLTPKVLDTSFSAIAIGEVDLKKVEPWDLPWKAKMGEKEWYFFCMRDRKYPTGSRTNRATEAGYWKATGKDREIFRFDKLVGMKKTLVFYKGRAPKGVKSNWVMHEYRLEGKNFVSTQSSKVSTKNEWVISRIFKKSSGGKKVHISGLVSTNTDCSEASYMPSLMEFSSDDQVSKRIIPTDHSSTLEIKKPLENLDLAPFSSSRDSGFSQHPLMFPNVSSQNFIFSNQFIPIPYPANLQHMISNTNVSQEESILRLLLEHNCTRQNVKMELSGDTTTTTDMSSTTTLSNQVGNSRAYGYGYQELPLITGGPVDLDCLWNF